MNIKKSLFLGLCSQYGWGTWIRTKEMPDSESGALPLGYTPIKIRQYSTDIMMVCQGIMQYLAEITC